MNNIKEEEQELFQLGSCTYNAEKTLEKCYELLDVKTEESVQVLYSAVEEFLFQDVDFSIISMLVPMWIMDGGLCAESSMSKETYEFFKNNAKHPIFNRFIYYYDLWKLIAGIQDRIQAVSDLLREFYQLIPCRLQYNNEDYTSGTRIGGRKETQIHIILNNIFVAMASIFDLLAKVACEQYKYNDYDFEVYKKMKSKDKTFNPDNIKDYDNSLREEGFLFSAPKVIRTILTFRNEFVHNGPWDLNCCVYYTAVDGEPADVILYSPDIDEYGNFISSGTRSKFYAQNNAINNALPSMIYEVVNILIRTILRIADLYRKDITKVSNDMYTMECVNVCGDYLTKLEMLSKKLKQEKEKIDE